jgi:undecaprenyl-diphosphatase
MPLFIVVLLAGLQGLAEVLPISGSGHGAIATIWLGGSSGMPPALLCGAILASMAFALRRSLVGAVSEGVRAIARPILFTTSPGAQVAAVTGVATTASLTISIVARPLVEAWNKVPLAVGVGLLVTAVGLASTRLAPRAQLETPSLLGAALVGLAHGLAVAPGASRVAAALTVLLWLRVKAARALDLALLLSLPILAITFAEGLLAGRADQDGIPIEAGTLVAALLVAYLATSLACAVLRAIVTRGRLAVFALWLMPLGLAMIAYARALPGPASPTTPASSLGLLGLEDTHSLDRKEG